MNLTERDKQVVWHPFTQAYLEKDRLEIIQAKGATLFAADGKKYIDINSSWWVNIHGHGNEYIGNAIAEQFKQLDHVIFAGATHPKAVELAENVIDLLPDDFAKVFFSDDGSTAVEVALKMAYQFWFNQGIPRKKILAMEGAYHGDTFGAMSVGQRGYFFEPFEHLFFDVDYIPFPTEENKESLLELVHEKLSTKEYAAVILEPLVQGSAGMRMYGADFLDLLVKACHAQDTLVIFDEVMTGWGRTGRLFAMEHIESIPDILCLSKGLTGGVLPLGLTVTKQNMFDAFLSEERSKALLHGHSFTGNALCCAAAVASIELIRTKETLDNIKRIEASFSGYRSELKSHRYIRNIRQMGVILAIELETGDQGYFADIRDKVYHFMIENGILMRPLGNVIFLNPPYCITNEELDFTYQKIKEMLKHLFEENN
jgi:adenosylmethionine-8-amino-7-oxononanoate aminotransferase